MTQAIADIRLDALEEAAYRDGVQSVRLSGERVVYVRWARCMWGCAECDTAPRPRYFIWTRPDSYIEVPRGWAERVLL